MNWRLATLSLASLTLILLAAAVINGWLPQINHHVFDEDFNGNDVELAIIDLKSGQKELYVPFYSVQPERVLMTLTSEQNSLFAAKVLLVPQAETRIGTLYSYQPIMIHDLKDHPLVQNVFNFMAHNGVTYNSIEFEGNHMLVMSSGLIINQQH
jgi:hypothetical protein